MSDDVSYERVEPLVAGVVPIEGGVEVLFWCRATGLEVRAEGRVGGSSGLARGAALAKGRLLGHVREGVGRSVRRAIQTGMLPGGAGAAAYKATSKFAGGPGGGGGPAGMSDDDRHAAVVAAFETVADRFRWDDAAGAYVGVVEGGGPAPASAPAAVLVAHAPAPAAATSASTPSAPAPAAPAPAAPAPAPAAPAAAAASATDTFMAQLEGYPVTSERDRSVVARIMAAVIAGEGGVGDHERTVFAGLAPGFELDATVALGPPGHFELASVGGAGVRDTILLLGWAVAVTDEALGAGEVAVLDAVAAGLGVSPEAAALIRRTAQAYVIEQAEIALVAAGWDPASTAAEIERLTTAIGVEKS